MVSGNFIFKTTKYFPIQWKKEMSFKNDNGGFGSGDEAW